MCFEVFMGTLRAVLCELRMPDISLDSEEEMRKLANNFQMSTNKPNPSCGCVGELDFLAIAVKKTPDAFMPRNFYCRKVMYSIPVQAMVGSDLRFRYMPSRCSGSTHEAATFEESELSSRLTQKQSKKLLAC